MDRHYFISVYTCNSNRMGEELGSYVYEKYHHTVIHKDDFFNIKADIQDKMLELEDKYKRCKPFRIKLFGFSEPFGIKCPYIIVQPDNDTNKAAFILSSQYIRNDILEYRRP